MLERIRNLYLCYALSILL